MTIVEKVVLLKEKHGTTWRDKSEWYWAMGLLEEILELIGSLLRIHSGPTDWELMQISAICMNWLELRNERRNRCPKSKQR